MSGKRGWTGVLLVTLALGTALALPAWADTPISGSWRGDVKYTGTDESFVTKITVRDMLVRGKKGGTSSYPTYDCGGKLIFRKREKATGRYLFTERLTFGDDICIDDGEVALRRTKRRLLYEWSISEGGDVNAAGKLKRTR